MPWCVNCRMLQVIRTYHHEAEAPVRSGPESRNDDLRSETESVTKRPESATKEPESETKET